MNWCSVAFSPSTSTSGLNPSGRWAVFDCIPHTAPLRSKIGPPLSPPRPAVDVSIDLIAIPLSVPDSRNRVIIPSFGNRGIGSDPGPRLKAPLSSSWRAPVISWKGKPTRQTLSPGLIEAGSRNVG